MPSSTASCTLRTASPSTARPCANHQKNPANVASLTPTTPSEQLKPSMGAAVRDHRNAVRDRSESLSAINRNTRPQSPESADFLGIRLAWVIGHAFCIVGTRDHEETRPRDHEKKTTVRVEDVDTLRVGAKLFQPAAIRSHLIR